MKTVVLGVSGSVAAYRACDIARELMRRGFTVRACLTDGAQRFVTAELFEALTGQPCLQDVFEEPEKGRMAHIDWARAADVLVVAPATANTLNALASGHADDMLTTIALAYEGPLVLAPAMNPSMLAHDTTQASLEALQARAAFIVEPGEGEVACGEQGQGKLASVAQIVEAVETVASVAATLKGKKVLVTSGPTEEPLDDVRVLTNRSSGKMGAAVARAALLMGAEVTVVAGPQRAPLPLRAKVINVKTAQEMLDAALPLAKGADFVVGVAAVADYRPERTAGKMRSGGEPNIALEPNPDIISELAKATSGKVLAFAAEPDDGLDKARRKMKAKGVHAIAVNDISRKDIGFDSDQNEVVLLTEKGERRSGKVSKLRCALWLLEQISGE
ncbi:MAG: bifunctional phosphopantothenoylcysteine decarboxylase/phosphopantothenate--cysteine ligase CoaBC [Armatimonadetes bacterium]|nr:bifunctional phosphopantothenoylcysteine decarboxylase/phosphopantothenate--cysteine ligase CoaBC [Armatimonadota bacterium]